MRRLLIFLVMFAFVGLSLTAKAQMVIDSGTCGENLTWVLTSDSVLTIRGSGNMTNYKHGTAPWLYSQDTIGFSIDGNEYEYNYPRYNSSITSVISVWLKTPIFQKISKI